MKNNHRKGANLYASGFMRLATRHQLVFKVKLVQPEGLEPSTFGFGDRHATINITLT